MPEDDGLLTVLVGAVLSVLVVFPMLLLMLDEGDEAESARG